MMDDFDFTLDEIVAEIDEILGTNYDKPPARAISVGQYAGEKGISTSWAAKMLREAYQDGRLERTRYHGKHWYWKPDV